MTQYNELNDQDLFATAWAADIELYYDEDTTDERAKELAKVVERTGQEIERRFGDGANDNLAGWFTASKASMQDALHLTAQHPEVIVAIAREGMEADPAYNRSRY